MSRIRPKRATGKSAIGPLAGGDAKEIDSVRILLHLELAEKIGCLPKDLAVTLISVGIVGAAIPGPIPPGPSFILLGTVILWPGLLARTGGPLARRFPGVFRMLIDFTEHLHADLARRYPKPPRL